MVNRPKKEGVTFGHFDPSKCPNVTPLISSGSPITNGPILGINITIEPSLKTNQSVAWVLLLEKLYFVSKMVIMWSKVVVSRCKSDFDARNVVKSHLRLVCLVSCDPSLVDVKVPIEPQSKTNKGVTWEL